MRALVERFLRAAGWMPVAEAVEQSDFEEQLRFVTSTPEQRAELRTVAIEAGKLGMTSADDAVQAICRGMSSPFVRIRDLQWAKSATPANIDRRIAEIWNES